MARYWVTSNAAEGFDGRRRGYPGKDHRDPVTLKVVEEYPGGFGWHWPKAGIEIEVLDQAEDPKHQPQGEGAVRTVGQRTLAALRADSHIFVGALEGTDENSELAKAKAKIAELEKQLAEKAAAAASAPPDGGAPPPAPSTKPQKGK